jgi:hypothetical protein
MREYRFGAISLYQVPILAVIFKVLALLGSFLRKTIITSQHWF